MGHPPRLVNLPWATASRAARGQRVSVLVNPEPRDVRIPVVDLPAALRVAVAAPGSGQADGADTWVFAPYEVRVLRAGE